MAWLRALGKAKYDVLVLLAILGYATYYYAEVYAISKTPINLLLVEPVYWILFICVVTLIVSNIRQARQSMTEQTSSATTDNEQASIKKALARRALYRHAASFGITTLLYVVALDWLGFVSSSFLYLSSLTFLLGARSIWLNLILPALVVGFLYVSMSIFLRLSLPEGWLI